MTFHKKCFSSYILLIDQILFPDWLHFLRCLSVYVYCLLTSFWYHTNSKIKFIFQIKPLLYMTKKSIQKYKYLENKNNFKRWSIKQFLSFLKGFLLPKIVSDLRVHLWNSFTFNQYVFIFFLEWIFYVTNHYLLLRLDFPIFGTNCRLCLFLTWRSINIVFFSRR